MTNKKISIFNKIKFSNEINLMIKNADLPHKTQTLALAEVEKNKINNNKLLQKDCHLDSSHSNILLKNNLTINNHKIKEFNLTRYSTSLHKFRKIYNKMFMIINLNLNKIINMDIIRISQI